MRQADGSAPMPAARLLRTRPSRALCFRISALGFPSGFGLRVSDFRSSPFLNAIALVSSAVRPRRLRLQHGPGRGAAARRAAARPAGAALLCLDRAGGVLWLLSEVCRASDADSAAPAGA